MVADIDLSGLTWRKSSASFNSSCVEVAAYGGVVMVRDTQDVGKTILAYPYRDWRMFLMQVRGNVSCEYIEPGGDSLLLRGTLC
jgi:hypothetical protein